MGRSIDMMATVRDNSSAPLHKMAGSAREAAHRMDELNSKMNVLNKTKATLQVDMKAAKGELHAGEKLLKATGDEALRLDMIAKQADYNNMGAQLKHVNSQANDAARELNKLENQMSKVQNRADGSGSDGGSGGAMSMLGKLASAGATHMIGQTVSNAADALITSTLGDTMGNTVSSVLSKAATGAAVGSLVGPIGTAVGAAAGAAMGAVDAAVQVFQKKDEAFKETVKANYESSMQAQNEALSSGSYISGRREISLMSWTTILGSEDRAKAFSNDIKEMANHTPFLYEDLDMMAKTMKTFGYEAEEILPTLTNIGDAGAALGMTTSDINMAATAIGRMKLTDKTSGEYLKMLIERGIPAYDYLAKAMGVTNAEVIEMVSKGLIPGSEAAKIIADSLGEDFGGAMEIQSKTFEGLSSTLQGAKDDLNNAMGEGYNTVRSTGMVKEIDYLNGETGAKMKEAYSMIGEWQASLVNLQEQYERDAMTAVMDGALGSFEGTEIADRLAKMNEEYQKLLVQQEQGNAEAGAKMGALLAEAQAIAQNEYMASEGFQIQQKANLDLINNIQADTAINSAYYNSGIKLGDEFTKGVTAGIFAGQDRISNAASGAAPKPHVYYNGLGERSDSKPSAKRNAWGQMRVPFDNYLTYLHEGEQVIPASEARGRTSEGGVVVNVYGMTVREEADVQKVALEFVRELSLARAITIGG